MIKSDIDCFTHDVFRAYDIRGIVDEQLDENLVFDIGRSIGSEVLDCGHDAILVARDGRLSGPKLLKALQSGISASGCDIIDVGVVPTPLLYFATHHHKIESGVMLTGSHNPANYNGLKIVIAGKTIFGEGIQSLKKRILTQSLRSGKGNIKSLPIESEYENYVVKDITLNKELKIIVDAGNGVAGKVAPSLFRKLGCNVIELYCDVDGSFPNHHPDPSKHANLKDLIDKVISENADIGLAFDGDGDRLGIITNQGNIINADRQIMLFAREVLKLNPNRTIVFDVKCSNNVSKYVSKFLGKPIMSATGHAFIKKKIKEVNAVFAGEMSGHIFFNDRWFGFDDGIYTAARLLEILSGVNEDSHDLFKEIPDSFNTPEINIPISDSLKFKLVDKLMTEAEIEFPGTELITIDGLRIQFDDGWGLVRASNTTPCLVCRFEANTMEDLNKIKNDMMNWIERFI